MKKQEMDRKKHDSDRAITRITSRLRRLDIRKVTREGQQQPVLVLVLLGPSAERAVVKAAMVQRPQRFFSDEEATALATSRFCADEETAEK